MVISMVHKYISCQKILGENMNNITIKLGKCMSQKVIVSTFVMMIIDHEIISRIILMPISQAMEIFEKPQWNITNIIDKLYLKSMDDCTEISISNFESIEIYETCIFIYLQMFICKISSKFKVDILLTKLNLTVLMEIK